MVQKRRIAIAGITVVAILVIYLCAALIISREDVPVANHPHIRPCKNGLRIAGDEGGRSCGTSEETYADSPTPTRPTLPMESKRMTPADYAKLIPTNFDATHPEGLPAYVPPSGGAMRATGGAYTLPNLGPVLHQYGGTCYAHAVVAAVCYWNMNHRSPPLPANASVLSRTFGYRYYEGRHPLDGGVSAYYFAGLQHVGGPSEQLWPHLWAPWYDQIIPSPQCFALAVRNSLDEASLYSTVQSAADACKAIDDGCPIIIYMYVDGDFAAFNPVNCVIRKPPSCSAVNHAMLAVGYDAVDGGRFLVQNSWGTGWGNKGFCYMPQSYFTACVLPFAYVLKNLKPYVPGVAHYSATATVTPGKTTATQVTQNNGAKLKDISPLVLQDVQSSACPYNDTHVVIYSAATIYAQSRIVGSVQLLFDVVPAGGYLLKLSAFVGPNATLAVSHDGVEQQFKGDVGDYVEETVAVREVQHVKLLFT